MPGKDLRWFDSLKRSSLLIHYAVKGHLPLVRLEVTVDSRMVLFAMTALAGFVMVVGGMWLIYKEKIYIDRESNKPIEVKLPGNFSFTSNFPALALFALGFFPLIYPLTN